MNNTSDTILACQRCGAYASRTSQIAARRLKASCRGACEGSRKLQHQRERFQQELFPGSAQRWHDVRLCEIRLPSAKEIDWLAMGSKQALTKLPAPAPISETPRAIADWLAGKQALTKLPAPAPISETPRTIAKGVKRMLK